MIQTYDSRVGWQVFNRNLDHLSTITVDKGYYWWLLRAQLRVEGLKTLIRTRGVGWDVVAEIAQMDDAT